MITFHGVTKDYDGHIALNHLDLTIEDGQIVGLIGHNGAGKSTTIKSLVSVITPSTGTIEVDGQDLYDMSQKDCDQRLEELLRIFDFQSHRYEVIESFSHGMRQKVFVIAALLSDPDIWVLDEPMTGLDPQASYDLKQMMRQHADRGKTVIFSTHVLEVAEQLCDKIAILKKGNLIFYGTIEELKGQHPEQSLESIYLSLAGRKEEGGDHAS